MGSPGGAIGIPADGLFSLVNRAHPQAIHMRIEHHLVQHTGAISARLSVRHAPSFNFARTRAFPYEEGLVLLDSNDEW